MDTNHRQQALENWSGELAAVYLYDRLARTEPGKAGELFGRLRHESERQARVWEEILRRAGDVPPAWRPTWRVRLVGWLAAHIGARRMLPVLSAMKVRGLALYRGGSEGETLAPGLPEESWHRAARGGGALRAAVFGVNDGLVSNASLILGVAAAEPDPRFVVLAGVAGMLAGGFSMASGEYVSVLTQRELLEHQLDIERQELETVPEEEIEELTIIYQAKGLNESEAQALARRIVADPERGLQTLAREELGLDPQGLASPGAAAAASFLSFVAGALVPLIPYLLAPERAAIAWTGALSLLGLLAVGGLMSLFTGRSLIWSALRMALIGSAAATATYLIGRLLGVSVS